VYKLSQTCKQNEKYFKKKTLKKKKKKKPHFNFKNVYFRGNLKHNPRERESMTKAAKDDVKKKK
jgi:hypothetical protein